MPRRLPVLPSNDDDDPSRPAWHWSPIGAALIFASWAPLAMLAQALSAALVARLVPPGDPAATSAWLARAGAAMRAAVWAAALGPPVAAFALASLAGGALVGRFGGRAGTREATVAGLGASLAAWALAASLVGVVAAVPTLVVLVALGTLAARAGSALGVRARR